MVVLIGASLLFIVASAATLVWGWLNGQQTLIWTSIACSVAAGILLLVAHIKTRRRPVIESVGTTASGTRTERRAERSGRVGLKSRLGRSRRAPETKPETPSAPKVATTTSTTSPAASTSPATSAAAVTGGAVEPETASVPATVGATRKRTRAKPEPGPAPAKRASSRAASTPAGEVVAVAERKKFHRPECRYAKAKGAEVMSKANARRRGLAPCGICKP